jgi:tetratricopeptide (TPR) repeat protein
MRIYPSNLFSRWLLPLAGVALLTPLGSAQLTPTDHTIKFFQVRISKDPEDFSNYDRLGAAYLQKGREIGDLAYYELAEKTLRKAMELASQDEAVSPQLHLAATLFSEHRFAESLALAQQAVAAEPKTIAGNAVLGDAYLETGEYERAAEAYAKLQSAEQRGEAALDYLYESRIANLNLLRGDTRAAVTHMQRAIAAAERTNIPKENLAWAQFTLGEYHWQAGELTKARTAAEASLHSFPRYHRALALLAQVRVAQGKYKEAASLYRRALAVVPLPVYAAALGDLLRKSGDASGAKQQYDLVEYMARLSALNESVYNRELAIFYADHGINLAQSVTLARKELEVRHDIYTWDALAWALYKNGQSQEALEALQPALRLDTKDPLLYFHAGMIYRATGNQSKAAEYLRAALAINPHFHVLYSAVAETTLASLRRQADPREQASNAH